MRALPVGSVVLLLLAMATPAHAQDKSEESKEATRVGTCADAKSQKEYFCNKDNSANDTMVGIGTACRNAELNVKEACEGVAQTDVEYSFEEKKN